MGVRYKIVVRERKVINKNTPPKIKQAIVPANPTIAIIIILPVSDKYVLGSFLENSLSNLHYQNSWSNKVHSNVQ